jgi:hypothetical protein
MNIIRLRLENFRRHRDVDVSLKRGLNIVRGPNESGKTTVQNAIEMGLFRRPTSSAQDLDETRPWADTQADPVVEIEFEDEGRPGRIRKVFAGQRGTVEFRVGEETLSDPAAVEAQIGRLTGLPSEKFFRATASVHHQELGGLTQDENTLRDRLQQSMSGADRGTYVARRKLEEAIRRYRTEGAKNPGYLKVLRGDVERLREQLRLGEQGLGQLEADRRALAQARAAREDLDGQLSEQREGLAKAERASSLAAKLSDAARRYAVYRRAAEIRDEIARLDSNHPSAVPLPQLKPTVEKLRNLEFDLSEMRAELAAEPDLSSYDVAVTVPRWRPLAIAGVLLLVAALVVLAIGLALGQTALGLVAGAVVGVVGLIALWRSTMQRRRTFDIRLQNELRETEIARRLTGRTQLAERVRQAEQERANMLANIGQSDLARAEVTLASETEHAARIDSLRAEYRGLFSNGDEPAGDEVPALRDQAAMEQDECRHALAGMGEIGREPDRHLSTYRLAIQRLTPQREAALQAEAQADARVSANTTDSEKVAADAEALETAEEALVAAERRLRVYEEILAALNTAEQATMKKAARFLEQGMAHDIEKVTGGRYRRLKVDEGTLTFLVFSPEANDWLDVRRLSQGTVDQLYLCARLGIVRQVTQPAEPPLVFDDPFITFDDERAQRAISLLKDIAREHQVIYLTTSDRYDSQADNVVVLAAPAERDEPEPVEPPSGPVETISMWSTAAVPEGATREPRSSRGNVTAAGRGATKAPPSSVAEPAPLWPSEDR